MTKPKPCPFCAKMPKIKIHREWIAPDQRYLNHIIISCNCKAHPFISTALESYGIDVWNRRHND